jgi:hypothetical protein
MVLSPRKREIAFRNYRTMIPDGCNRRTEKSVLDCPRGRMSATRQKAAYSFLPANQ